MIRSLRLSNFKAFADVEIPLGKFTLLSGLNSSGKSTVLQSLALLRQAYDAQHGIVGGNQDAPGLPLNGEYVQLGTGRDVLHEDYAGKTPKIGFEIVLDNGSGTSAVAGYQQEDDVLPFEKQPFQTSVWASASIAKPGFQYLRADRINPAVTYARSYEMAVRRGFLGTRGEYAIDYLRQHQDDVIPEHLRHPNGESPRLLAQVDAWLSEICPGVRITPEEIENTDLVRLGFQFATPGRPVGQQRRPTNVGFGLTYVLPVVIACVTAQPGAMILIENPEAHVHPRGQSAMARLGCAAAKHSQVVVETHSDHVLNGVRLQVKNAAMVAEDVQLHYFHRGDAGTVDIVSPTIGPDGMLSVWPDGFFDEWDEAIDELLS